MSAPQSEGDALLAIRDRAKERHNSGQIGGVREWYEIDFLLGYIDRHCTLRGAGDDPA